MSHFTVAELRLILLRLTFLRRKAVMFALEADLLPQQVVGLTWPLAFKLKLSEFGNVILMGMPRHLTLPYVFWEYRADAKAAPLYDLEESLVINTRLTYKRLKELYDTMIWTDRAADAADFKKQFDAVTSQIKK